MTEVNGIERAVKSFGKAVVYAWDWPDVPANHYNADDRKKLRRFSDYFTGLAAITASSGAVMNEMTVPAIITLTAGAIAGGRYVAGVVSEAARSREGQGPRP